MRRSSNAGVVVLSVCAGFVGGIASNAFHGAEAQPSKFSQQSQVALANSTDGKIQGLESRATQLEQKLAALKTSYENHEHSYMPPLCSAKMTLRNLQQAMNADPDGYSVCLGTRDFPGGHMAATTKPNP
jgi:TolA-binding protein